MTFHNIFPVLRVTKSLCRPMLRITSCTISDSMSTCARTHPLYHVTVRNLKRCRELWFQTQPLLGSNLMKTDAIAPGRMYEARVALHTCSLAHCPTTLSGRPIEKKGDNSSSIPDTGAHTGWVIRLANENGYLSWCRNTYLATVVGVGMWAEGPSSIAFHATEGALFLGGLNLVLGTISYLHTIFRVRKTIHMSVVGAGLHTLAALTHLGMWLTVVITYLGYVEAEEEVRHPGTTRLDLDKLEASMRDSPPK